MKTIRFLLTAVLLALTSSMFGDELVIQDFTIMPGETKDISIELNNPENPYILLEFEVIFPEGISIAKDEDDELLVGLNSARIAKSHTLEVADHGGGNYKFLVYSSKNAAFKGTSGEIISVTLKASETAAGGEFQGKITGQLFSKVDETGYYPEDKTFKVTIKGEENITVTAKDYSRQYGEANPTFEYTVEGGTLNGTPKISCSATATSPVGTYPITVIKGTETNGSVTYVAGTLTITKAPLTISGGTYTMKQSDALPELKAEYSGFKNGETEAVLTKKPTLTTTATSSSAPGEYEVKVSGAEAKNYDISYKPGKITVTYSTINEMQKMTRNCEYMWQRIDDIYSNITDGKMFIPTHKSILDDVFSSMKNDIINMIGAVKPYELSEQDFQNIRKKYDELMQKISEENWSSPLYTFTHYIQTGTFSCNEGGCILIDNTLEIRNEKKTIYSFYPKAFDNNYDSKMPEFKISFVPDNGYRLASFKMNGEETSKTYFDCFDAASNFVATFEPTGSDGIETVLIDGKSINIYSLQGKIVRKNAKDVIGLPKGVYIVNGRKVIVK